MLNYHLRGLLCCLSDIQKMPVTILSGNWPMEQVEFYVTSWMNWMWNFKWYLDLLSCQSGTSSSSFLFNIHNQLSFKGFQITETWFSLEHRKLSRRLNVPDMILCSLETDAEGATASAFAPNLNFPVEPGFVEEGNPNCYTGRFGLNRYLLSVHTGCQRSPCFWSSVQVLQWWGCYE